MGYARAIIEDVGAVETDRIQLQPRVSAGGTRALLIRRVSIKQMQPPGEVEAPDTLMGYRVRLFDHPSRRMAFLEMVVPNGGQEAISNRPDALLPDQMIRAQTHTGYLYATAEAVGPVGEGLEKVVLVEVMTSRP